MTTPRVTIGLPVYNGEDFLAESLDALLGQSFADLELVISDNASTDGTESICRRFAAADSRVRYLRQEHNIGAAPNHDAVLRAARGELFMWAAHDDLYSPDLVARCVAELDRHPDAVLCHADMTIVDSAGRVVETCEYRPRTADPDPVERFHSLLHADGGDDEYGVVRTAVAQTVRPAASYHHPGRTWVAELALHGPFRHVPEPLFARRDHPGRGDRRPTVRAVCANLEPRRAGHSTARLLAEYVWGYVQAVGAAPITARQRLRCLGHLAGWMARRAARRPSPTAVAAPAPAGPRIGLFGILGSGNLGNDGSLDATVRALRERHPDVRLGFMGMGPEQLTRRYDAPATHLQWYEAHGARLRVLPGPLLKTVGRVLDVGRTASWARGHDVVVVPGMGVLEATLPLRPWAFPFSLLCLGAAGRLFGTRVVLLGVGASSVRPRATRWVVATAARLAHERSFRDELSRSAVRDMGVDVTRDEVHPDLAFALPSPRRAPGGSGAVGVGLMAYHGGNDDRADADALHAAYLAAMTGFIRHLVDSGRPVRLFTGDPVDVEVVEHVLADVRAHRPDLPPGAVVAEPTPTLEDLMAGMAQVDTVVATRYHNVLCALKVGLPTVSVGYAAKNDELMAAMGLGAFCQAARAVDLPLLIAQFDEVESRRDELTAVLQERNRELAARLRRRFDALLPAAVVPAARPEHLAAGARMEAS